RCAATRCQRFFVRCTIEAIATRRGNSAQGHVCPRRFAENGITAAAGSTLASGRHDSRALLTKPIDPVWPPTSAMLVGVVQESIERGARFSRPVLVLLRCRRIDHSSYVTAPGQHEAYRAAEVVE